MKIDIDSTPAVVTLGDLEPGEVFQFSRRERDYFLLMDCPSKATGYYINLETGKRYGECKSTVVRRVYNVRLTNK